MHGTAGSLENFAANIAAHARRFNCIACNMIGSGMTDKPDYDYETQHYVKHAVDFLNAIGVKKASMVGLSLGARVATRLAIDHSQLVDKLILLSATAYFPAKPIQDDIKRSRSAAATNPTWENIFEIFKGLFHDPDKVWDDLIATRLAIYKRPDMKTAMPHILALLDPQVYDRNRIPDDDRSCQPEKSEREDDGEPPPRRAMPGFVAPYPVAHHRRPSPPNRPKRIALRRAGQAADRHPLQRTKMGCAPIFV